jgi:hypothetical protein
MRGIELLLLGSVWLCLRAYIIAEGQGVPFRAGAVRAW